MVVYWILLNQTAIHSFFQPQLTKLSSSSRQYSRWEEDAVTGSFLYEEPQSGWNLFKDSVYDSFDTIRKIVGNRNPRTDVATSSHSNIYNGFSNTVETALIATPSIQSSLERQQGSLSITPGARLLKQYEQSTHSKSQSFSPLLNDENLRSRPRRSIFDTSKDFFYDKVDKIKSLGKTDQTMEISSLNLSLKSIERASLTKVEPLPTPSSSSNDELTSRNPIKRIKAKITSAIAERNRKRRVFVQKIQTEIDQTKETMYATIDGIKEVGDTIVRIPEKCNELVGEIGNSIDETKRKVQNLVDDVTAIPERIQSAATAVKDTVDNTVRTTNDIVQDIQNIPATIQENIQQTSMKIDQTKEIINQSIKQVQEITSQAKVLVGLEKAKPAPPSPPVVTKPKSNPLLAFEIASSALVSLAKLAIYLGQGLVNVGISTSKAGRSMFEDSKRKKEERVKTPELNKSSEPSITKTPQINPSISLAEIDPNLDREVSEALRLASEAMSKSSENASINLPHIDPILEKEVSEGLLLAVSDTVKKAAVTKDHDVSAASVILAQIDPNLEREVSEALRQESQTINKVAHLEKRQKKKKSDLSAEVEAALTNAKAAAAQAVSDAAELEKIVKKEI